MIIGVIAGRVGRVTGNHIAGPKTVRAVKLRAFIIVALVGGRPKLFVTAGAMVVCSRVFLFVDMRAVRLNDRMNVVKTNRYLDGFHGFNDKYTDPMNAAWRNRVKLSVTVVVPSQSWAERDSKWVSNELMKASFEGAARMKMSPLGVDGDGERD